MYCNRLCFIINMTGFVLNTHEAIKKLVKSGQDEKSAEAIVALLTEVHEHVATKNDTAALRSDIQLLEQKLTVKLYSVGIAVVGILTAFKYWG